ncbi:DUF7218 family protein [Mycobacterium sp.]|uniref:DUF7218 family protein n=1 Tax=Mycobacterium sp. TaxID=1785 RepID=UPI003F7FF4B2
MTKDHGSSVRNDKQYEGLRKKGMSKPRGAAISNSPGASSRRGKAQEAAVAAVAAAAATSRAASSS